MNRTFAPTNRRYSKAAIVRKTKFGPRISRTDNAKNYLFPALFGIETKSSAGIVFYFELKNIPAPIRKNSALTCAHAGHCWILLLLSVNKVYRLLVFRTIKLTPKSCPSFARNSRGFWRVSVVLLQPKSRTLSSINKQLWVKVVLRLVIGFSIGSRISDTFR